MLGLDKIDVADWPVIVYDVDEPPVKELLHVSTADAAASDWSMGSAQGRCPSPSRDPKKSIET
jgi:hypothetical protein